MATTTNFGWSTPDDTSLVKDGAAAIRTLGNSIDTSFVDLKGGTTNQVLAKNSNTDLDFKWVADATGIPATIFDAKGDIIAATAADTADRLAVGTNGQVLTADSTTAIGLKWATPAAGGLTSIASGSLSGASVSLTTISGSYKNLQLWIKNFKPATDNSSINMRINNISTASYTTLGQGSDVTDFSWTQTEIGVGYGNDNATATGFTVINFFDYANAVTSKIGDYYSLTVDSSAPTTDYNYRSAKWATKPTTAITQIDLICSSGNFTSGDYVLYGVN